MYKLLVAAGKIKQLARFADHPARFRFFFLIGGTWKEGEAVNKDAFIVDGKNMKSSGLSSYVITYRNGQLVHESKSFDRYPDALQDIEAGFPNETVFTLDELTAGNHLMAIRFEKSSVIRNRKYYKTTIVNKSGERVKIIRFGGVREMGSATYCLNTITNDFFSESEFNNWYMDSSENWIEPDQEVSDPINYGGNGEGWIFEAQLGSGKRFWFSSINVNHRH
jgi:hypothetical protein